MSNDGGSSSVERQDGSRGGVVMITRAGDIEWPKYKIRVYAIGSRAVSTPLTDYVKYTCSKKD